MPTRSKEVTGRLEMKYRMLVQHISNRLLQSGDKNFDVTLRLVEPEKIKELLWLNDELEVVVSFDKMSDR